MYPNVRDALTPLVRIPVAPSKITPHARPAFSASHWSSLDATARPDTTSRLNERVPATDLFTGVVLHRRPVR